MTANVATLRELETIVLRVLSRLRREDDALLRLATHEVSLTGRLASYFEQALPGYKVDSDYDRHLSSPKSYRDGAHWTTARPDIVVHSRETDSGNLLVVEVKKRKLKSTPIDRQDRIKLVELTKLGATEDHYFSYAYGLYIGVLGLSSINLIWFINGIQQLNSWFEFDDSSVESSGYLKASEEGIFLT